MQAGYTHLDETIVALATPPGMGALAVLRVSGPEAWQKVDSVFRSARKGRGLLGSKGYTLHYGHLMKGEEVVDEVLVSLFKGPRSFTGEDTVEISLHGSVLIQRAALDLLTGMGVRMAQPGEFTLRAFLNGRIDLTQAEAVADLIAADSDAAHRMALHQLKGGFSRELSALREQLVHFASLVELELDFAEEDVEFANRSELKQLIAQASARMQHLIASFRQGNAAREGLAVAIVGAPNAGKSTLLNALLNEERALVSPVAGTTRDTIEDSLHLGGYRFRFIDTAGLRETNDVVEQMGIARALSRSAEARLVLLVVDAAEVDAARVAEEAKRPEWLGKPLVVVLNKTDLLADQGNAPAEALRRSGLEVLCCSAKEGRGVAALKKHLIDEVNQGEAAADDAVVSNIRHLHALEATHQALSRVGAGLDARIPGDLLAQDIRLALYHLGEITGTIHHDELLGNIFSRFCIGK
jgi:tRNA modification GTPase